MYTGEVVSVVLEPTDILKVDALAIRADRSRSAMLRELIRRAFDASGMPPIEPVTTATTKRKGKR
jgi:predicted transcriptional regulator